MLAGNFNSMLKDDDKKGESKKLKGSCPLFQQFCFAYGLKDIGFQGPRYTWNRGLVFQLLDRALCNYHWDRLVPNMMVHHLYKPKFDHRLLGINFGIRNLSRVPRPFRFLSCWLSHSNFASFVKEN